VGTGAAVTRGAPGVALRGPRVALSREVRTGAAGTRGGPGATLCGPRAALSRQVGTGATGTRGALGVALCWETGAARASLLLVVSNNFFLVASYCPTKNSRVLKNAAILQRSHHRHRSYALAVVMVSSSTSSSHVPVLRCSVLFNSTNYHD
jgi:hypothetical protein